MARRDATKEVLDAITQSLDWPTEDETVDCSVEEALPTPDYPEVDVLANRVQFDYHLLGGAVGATFIANLYLDELVRKTKMGAASANDYEVDALWLGRRIEGGSPWVFACATAHRTLVGYLPLSPMLIRKALYAHARWDSKAVYSPMWTTSGRRVMVDISPAIAELVYRANIRFGICSLAELESAVDSVTKTAGYTDFLTTDEYPLDGKVMIMRVSG